MKKLFYSLVTLLILASTGLNLSASTKIELLPPPGTYTCYATYDPGTTTFVDCYDCTQKSAAGSNLRDKSTCTP